jgi:hypothetical protein
MVRQYPSLDSVVVQKRGNPALPLSSNRSGIAGCSEVVILFFPFGCKIYQAGKFFTGIFSCSFHDHRVSVLLAATFKSGAL